MAGLAAGFFQQLHVTDGHAAVCGFAHVVDGQEGDLYGGEGFHFHTGLVAGFRGGPAINSYKYSVHVVCHVICRSSDLI